ncbi:hypothetical protein IEZ26_16555 [Nocardioides cavernae]|uniref:Uncharacterized protein n=1 Tax=Nocardioides cavernae TaxID=1921566 RepID=A0ABR8NDN4_9ACTN|nr:hypothetical protein [Nocardioides cavernae]MBD3926238.1 hypothetical protein [Nocardioides cavernae]MBM7513831.1 hypothetical protein [Nocardioides cavernae]
MLEPGPGLDPGRHLRLTSLLEDVKAARRLLDLARHDKRHVEQQQLRRDLLASLEAYAAALTLAGAPVPPRLRSEINLYKGLGARG